MIEIAIGDLQDYDEMAFCSSRFLACVHRGILVTPGRQAIFLHCCLQIASSNSFRTALAATASCALSEIEATQD